MGCCPPAPPIVVSDFVPAPGGVGSPIAPGESVECYSARAGNSTGKMDDATDLVQNKIENTSIPINTTNASVNVTFKLTSTSVAVPATWVLTEEALPFSAIGVTFTSLGTTATLIGTFDPGDYDLPYEVLLEAFDAGAALIDSRTFKFSPTITTNTDSVKLISPLPGAIVNSKYGPRKHPISGEEKMHSGIDMKFVDRSVADVVAAADGEVTFAGVNGTLTSGYGNCVKITHTNGSGQKLCTTIYGHLAKIYVAPGQKVSAGQKIGLEGTTGSSTGNHLHFEVRLPNGNPTNPVPYIQGGVSVSDTTTPTGNPGSTPVPSGNIGAAFSAASVAAQSTPC